LADVKVLDPACGSGNFLYVAINLLLDLEKEVITYGANHGVSWFPQVSPRQLAGLEINPYAQQLAQVVIWIGYLQWLHHNGFKTPSNPVLEPIENIHLKDAILDLSKQTRLLCTPMTAKHRIFTWLPPVIQPDKGTYCFARSDDFFFGVLQSRLHEVWALKLGTRLETRPRYTPTTCFETFPFPQPTEYQQTAIAEAAKELDQLRNNWLNPSEWTREEVLEFPGSVNGPWARFLHEPDARGIGTVRYPRIVAKDPDFAKLLAKRTLTNLYNERPTWLDLAHRKLDEAVFAAYGWDPAMSDEEILAKLLKLNLERNGQHA
jgi:hypothetical protein